MEQSPRHLLSSSSGLELLDRPCASSSPPLPPCPSPAGSYAAFLAQAFPAVSGSHRLFIPLL